MEESARGRWRGFVRGGVYGDWEYAVYRSSGDGRKSIESDSKSKLSKRVRFCLYTDRSLYESWMRKLVETKEKVAKEGWNAVGVTDGGGWISPINSRKKYMLGNPFEYFCCVLRRVSGRVGGREVDEASRKERGETKIERWWKSIEYEFTADVFLEEDCFFSGNCAARRERSLRTEIRVVCGDAGEMFEELEGRFPSEREIEKGEGE